MAQARPPIPKVVPIPSGWRRAVPKEITSTIQRAAVRALQQALPIGKLQATEVDGKLVAFQTEWHYDDHVTKPGQPIWHPGISTLMPLKQPAKIDKAQVERLVASTMNLNQPAVAGEPGEFAGEFAADDVGDDVGDDDIGADGTMFDADLSHYDAVHGDEFGDEMGDENSFGDEFGGRKKKRKGKARAQVSAKGSFKANVSVGRGKKRGKKRPAAKPARRPAAGRPAARPAARPVTGKPAASRPMPSAVRTTDTRTDSPLGPSAMMPSGGGGGYAESSGGGGGYAEPSGGGGGYAEPSGGGAAPEEQPQGVDAATESALDAYEMPAEETPETADEGSDTEDLSAVGSEFCISG